MDSAELQLEIYARTVERIRASVDPGLRARIDATVAETFEERRAYRQRLASVAGNAFTPADQLEAYRGVLFKLNLMANIDGREFLAGLFAAVVNGSVPRGESAGEDSSPAAALAGQGLCRLDLGLTPMQIAEIVAHLSDRPCYNSHTAFEGDKVARRLGAGAEAFHYASYSLTDIVRAPHLVELANHPGLLAIAERYLDCTPTLYSLNAWWSFPGKSEIAKVAQSFHRDRDDVRFCTLFVYLTDVDMESGPNVYVRGTHRRAPIERHLAERPDAVRALDAEDRALLDAGALYGAEGYGSDRLIEGLFADRVEITTGPAGTAFLADTYGYHKGTPPRSKRRLMFWARYATRPIYPAAYRVSWSLAPSRLAAEARARYVNRGIFGD